MHVVYLHGFASSPQSSKVGLFTERFAALGVPVHCPDLNAPDFSTLTITRMIETAEATIDGLGEVPVVLVGSSLGAFVAWHVAARATLPRPHFKARLERLVLLAPAVAFGTEGFRSVGAQALQEWRATGWRSFFHYALNEERPVHYALHEDALRYRIDRARATLPTLIVQGAKDDVVSPDAVVAFAASRPNVLLRLVDDGHQLLERFDEVWADTTAFLGSTLPRIDPSTHSW